MSVRRAPLLALVLLVGACAHARHQRGMELGGLIGSDEAAVVRTMGPPTRSLDQGPLRLLVYDRTDVERVHPLTQGGFHAVSFACRITLVLEGGRVRSFDQQGAGCG